MPNVNTRPAGRFQLVTISLIHFLIPVCQVLRVSERKLASDRCDAQLQAESLMSQLDDEGMQVGRRGVRIVTK